MVEFETLCDVYEAMPMVEKGKFLTEKSVGILQKLRNRSMEDPEVIPALAGFLIGSAVADGIVNEREYLLIYPSLARVFGDNFDFASIKASFRRESDGRNRGAIYAENLLRVLVRSEDDLKTDIIMLCLCVVSINGTVSMKQKHYIRKIYTT